MYTTKPCSVCQGPYHPATGHAWSQETVLCGPCAGRFFAWVVRHTSRRWGGQSFYEAAASSVKAVETSEDPRGEDPEG
jgi:hypothetical protein